MAKKEKTAKKTAKKTVERRIVPNAKAKIYKDQSGNEHLVVLDEKTFYTFTNRRPGMCFFTRESGEEAFFEGHETKEDITPKEKKMFLNSTDYQNGWLVEEFESGEGDEDIPENSYSESKLSKMIDTWESTALKNHINSMTSEFAVKGFKDLLIKKDAPSSLSALCDYKLKELEEIYLKEKEAPLDSEERKKL